MYRQYEDPRKLEEELKEAKERLNDPDYEADEYDYERIAELEERINFAWQDEEYDENCRREAIRLGEIEENDYER